jgi:hypothetical protein
MVYPLSAKQFVNGVWVDVECKSYQGGKWVDWWDGELFYKNNQYEDITGGWKSGWTGSDGHVAGGWREGSISFTDEGMNLSVETPGILLATHERKIDLTKYQQIKIEMASLAGNNNAIWCGPVISTSNTIQDNPAGEMSAPNKHFIAKASFTHSNTHVLDISGITGEYYVGIFLYARNAISAVVTKIQML